MSLLRADNPTISPQGLLSGWILGLLILSHALQQCPLVIDVFLIHVTASQQVWILY